MNKNNFKTKILFLPILLWIIIVPVIVKVIVLPNPLQNYAWYNGAESIFDFFLYYKSQAVTILGALMLFLFCWQVRKLHRKKDLLNPDFAIFIPLGIYILLASLSSLLSPYREFCVKGMPDQYENIWNLIAYAIVTVYCYWLIVRENGESKLQTFIYAGAALVGIICVLQFFKIDIYRIIYSKENYGFIFPLGTVYGPFYNINYVGYYALLVIPLFLLMLLFYSNINIRIISAMLLVSMIITIIGAKSSTAFIALAAVVVFAVLFLLIKGIQNMRWLMIPTVSLILIGICMFIFIYPHIRRYVQSSDTEQTDLEHIYTNDDNVEIDYRGQKLYVSMNISEDMYSFSVYDQNQEMLTTTYCPDENGYYFTIDDHRFEGIKLTPAIISEDPEIYGFMVFIDDRNWVFSNQVSEDGTYYYYSSVGSMTKITAENQSADFEPLKHVTNLASGRGYIWNKTMAILNDYFVLGSGADTFALVYPNYDYVDKYNNGYDNMVITKPHNLYLQIAVQTGMLSLICFLVFYFWYFFSSLKIYYKSELNSALTITGFAIMLGTLGYMISGLTNDSTITVAPLYWALMGVGIGINHKIKAEIR